MAGWQELNDEDSGEDEGGTEQGAAAQDVVEDEERGEPAEDGFEGEDEDGVSGRKNLLGKTLNREGSGGG